MQVDASIFKAYDIRGIYPDQLDEELAYAVGRAFVTFLKADEVVVGRDMRLAGPQMKASLIRGLTDQGADVIDIGMVSTDQYYYACATLEKPGLMVTASHNPPEYCGFKMVREMPYLLSGDEGIQDLRRIIEAEEYAPSPSAKGQVVEKELSQGFVDKVLTLTDPADIAPLKVVADTGNGMVGPILERVYEKLPVELIGMFLEPDGRVPNHGLDPMQPENRADLEQRIVDEKADIGFAFDGDGDRFFIVDDRGLFVPGDFITALMGCYMLEKYPGAKIVYDVRCSWAVRDMISKAGGIPLIERVGHSFLKPRMFEEGAVFAGELSGHYYFQDFYGADSGIVPSLLVLEMLSRKGQKLSELLAPLEAQYFLSGEINSRVEDTNVKIQALAERYGDGLVERIDGISVSYDTWHFNVRASNTEPLLRLNLEALSQEQMEEKRDELLNFIRS
ncbi:MAG: phosphomannomutase/phosphoglucomutase [Gemmatimonadetes bacterium]|jgi:phosphomannomutase|nr:phosphomannomutase/phosphoglucomutase [Gemmatimonadota bacterium]